jgi:hypothetical protein
MLSDPELSLAKAQWSRSIPIGANTLALRALRYNSRSLDSVRISPCEIPTSLGMTICLEGLQIGPSRPILD